MTTSVQSIAVGIAGWLLLLSPVVAQRSMPPSPAPSPAPAIILSEETIQPGDVLRLTVSGASATQHVTGTALGRTFVFHFDEGRRAWDALLGVDLDVTPGMYPLRIEMGDGKPLTQMIRVTPKAFTIRRLRVSPDFVTPPADALERIGRELKTTEAIFHRTTSHRWNGSFLLPIDTTPTSNFGTRSYFNGVRRSPHAGVDFMGAPGTPIRAANHGGVALAEPLYFTGNTVIVDYGDGLYSLFAHLSELKVKTGDSVSPDTIVGLLGATGRVTGPHLHWSVRLQGARVDPLSLVAATK